MAGLGGIGIGAFAQGLASGLNTGLKLGNVIKTGRAERAKREAFDNARKDYDKLIGDEAMSQVGQTVGLGGEVNMEAAKDQAKQKVGSFTDFLYNQKMPEIIDTFVQQGDLEGAEKLRQWAQDAKERKFMDRFGQTLGAWAAGNSSGDYTQFAESAVKLLNDGGYGLKATGYEFIKDGDGKTTGLTFKLKDNKGKEFSHTFNSIDEAAQFLSAQGSPQTRVKQWLQQQEAATKLKADVAKEEMKAGIGLRKDLAIEDAKQKNRKELEGIRADHQLQLQASRNRDGAIKEQQTDEYVIGVLRSRGFTDDDVSAYLANKYLGGYRKGKSPQEFAQQIISDLAKDPMVADKSPENLKRIARGLMDAAAELGQAAPVRRPGAPAQRSDIPVYR